ncbi:hypothetical protein EI94DRAFT_712700 [Lactarius quietus]|nr:hypothetical protein EI94DRAFT_712700 [Lactarius quietus]
MPQPDAVVALNNYLQGYPGGSITDKLSWNMTEKGPGHQLTHCAIANFEGVEIGKGTGVSKGNAKADAAVQALQYLRQNRPYPGRAYPQCVQI